MKIQLSMAIIKYNLRAQNVIEKGYKMNKMVGW